MLKFLRTHDVSMPPWLIPLVYVGVTVAFGLVFPRLEQEYLAHYHHGMSVASAQAVLSAIASGMMALTGIVFALAFVMVQFSAIAYSPRLVTWFGRDPVLFHSLGLFTATFIYAIATLGWTDRGEDGKAPLFSVLLVTVLLILSMIVFARLVQRLSDIQITNVLHFIGQQGRAVIREMFPRLEPVGATPESWQQAAQAARQSPVTQTLRYSGEPQTLARFQVDVLVRLAREADAVIVMECAVGDTLTEDTLLLRVHGGRVPVVETSLRGALRLARERTFEQDPQFALRLLVDIAIRALSPAINDPTTAVQALDQIEDLLHRLGRRALDAGCVMDDRGVLRLVFPTPTWEDYLTLAFDEIRQYGAGSVQVMRRLRSALVGLVDSVTETERQEVLRRYLHHLDSTVEHSVLDAEDQAMALREDRQGLGLSRREAEK
jgi:uncharacterized membrane protein